MAHEVLNDFVKFSDVSSDIFQRYEGILPDKMISLWKEKGFGTFYDGYLKIINPDDYKHLIEKSYFQWDFQFQYLRRHLAIFLLGRKINMSELLSIDTEIMM